MNFRRLIYFFALLLLVSATIGTQFGLMVPAHGGLVLDGDPFAIRTAPKLPKQKSPEGYGKDNSFDYLYAWVVPGEGWYNLQDPATLEIATLPDAKAEDVANWEKQQTAGTLSPQSAFKLTLHRAHSGNTAGAVALIEQELRKLPGQYPYLTLRAAIERAAGRDDLALEDLKAADAWREAYYWHYFSDPYGRPHSDQEGMIHSALAELLASKGQMETKGKAWGAKTYLAFAVRVRDRVGGEGLRRIAGRAEAAVNARLSGADPVMVAAMNRAVETAPMECVDTGMLETAYRTGFRKGEAGPRLLETLELCGNFARAKELRAADTTLANRPPFETRRWQMPCPDQPEKLHAAFDAGYQKRLVGIRLTKYYLGCNRPDLALPVIDRVVADFDLTAVRSRAELMPYIELAKLRSTAQFGTGNMVSAGFTLNGAVKMLAVYDAPDSADLTALIQEDLRVLIAANKGASAEDRQYIKQMADGLTALVTSRAAIIQAKNAETEAAGKRCVAMAPAADARWRETESASQMATMESKVFNWSDLSRRLRGMEDSARKDQCPQILIDRINQLANNACQLSKAADRQIIALLGNSSKLVSCFEM